MQDDLSKVQLAGGALGPRGQGGVSGLILKRVESAVTGEKKGISRIASPQEVSTADYRTKGQKDRVRVTKTFALAGAERRDGPDAEGMWF